MVIARLSQPDAADLFRIESPIDDIEAELRSIRQRREELVDLVADGVLSAGLARPRLVALADLVADGVLTAGVARPRLVALAEQMAVLEARRAPGAISFDQTVGPEDVWAAWTMPQRREVLRVLFSKIALRHTGGRGGPRADPTRLELEWARD